MPTTTPSLMTPGAKAAMVALCSPQCSALTNAPCSDSVSYPALRSRVLITPPIMKSAGRWLTTTRTRDEGMRLGPSLMGNDTGCEADPS